jgi:hypothetical protein
MRPIAVEETEHARLAFSVGRWLHRRLDQAERRSVRRAQLTAVTQLAKELLTDPPAVLTQAAGLPTKEVAGHMIAEAQRLLWSSG